MNGGLVSQVSTQYMSLLKHNDKDEIIQLDGFYKSTSINEIKTKKNPIILYFYFLLIYKNKD